MSLYKEKEEGDVVQKPDSSISRTQLCVYEECLNPWENPLRQ